MAFKSIDEVASGSSLAGLFRHANALRAMQQQVAAALPASLRPRVEVGAWHDGMLTLHTADGAVASKLRNLLPSVLGQLSQAGWQVSEIFVRVQAKNVESSGVGQNRLHLPPQALEAFRQLAASLPPSDLKKSINTMVKRHQKDR